MMAAIGTWSGDAAIDRWAGTPKAGANVGPSLTPTTDNAMESTSGRAAQAFPEVVPAFNMEVKEVEPHPQPPRAQLDEQVSQASSSVSTEAGSPPADAALQWQLTVVLVPLPDLGLLAIKGHTVLIFASGAGKVVASGS